MAAAATGKLPALSPMPPAPDKAYLERTAAWDFDIFSVPYERLPRLAFSVLVTHPSIAASASTDRWIDQPKLWRFVCAIFEHYHERPFHNFRHATDVLRECPTRRPNAHPRDSRARPARRERPLCFRSADGYRVPGPLPGVEPRGRHRSGDDEHSASHLQGPSAPL